MDDWQDHAADCWKALIGLPEWCHWLLAGVLIWLGFLLWILT